MPSLVITDQQINEQKGGGGGGIYGLYGSSENTSALIGLKYYWFCLPLQLP